MKCSRFLLGCFLVSLCACSEKNEETLFVLKSSEQTGITFNNRIVETDSSNILTNEYIFNGGGVAVGDFNNDQKPDLFFTGNQVPNKLYLNQGDFRFSDVSAEAKIQAPNRWSTGVAIVDINNDNWLDIYVCAAMAADDEKRANMLFVHQGLDKNGVPTFIEMAKAYGIDDANNSMGATFFDYDKDGFLDLYVLNNEQVHTLPTNYRPRINDGSAISNDRLYHNNHDGTFTDVTLKAGIIFEGFGLGIAVADLDYDGWPDLHISNDYLTNDLLYINNQDGTFSNSIKGILKHQSKFSMGSDIADYNNDGYLDIITLDMLPETNFRMKTTIGNNNYINYVFNERWGYEYQYSRNMLHKGNGPGVPFSEIGLMTGIAKTDWSWSPLFVDADNDGFRDLLITNGFPRDITDKDFGDYNLSVSQFLRPAKILDSIPIVKIPNYAFRNNGDGLFIDTSKPWGLNISSFSNGAAFVDLDDDGDMDYVVNNINEQAFVFENTAGAHDVSKNQFLKIDLEGPEHNPMGIGAKLVIRLGENQFQYHEHYLTRGYMSSVDQVVHFGLGNHKKVTSLEVLWPDGKFQKLSDIQSNQTVHVAHKKAKTIASSQISFPLVPKTMKAIFKEVSNEIGIDFVHQELDVVDYNVQRVLPHKLTQNGPCLAVGDLDQDGFEDFIVGSSSTFSPMMFFQKADGTFTKKPLFTKEMDKLYEEEGMVLFDLENDGDLDLYLVSGSNEFEKGSVQYTDRLLVNDGEGNFVWVPEKMPTINANGSVVKAKDFDQDGFVDLFVGGRTPIAQFPLPERSFLLKNNNGTLTDVTEAFVPELRNVGMVTDAAWVDIDSDSIDDLVVVGEYMPITIFKNQKTALSELKATGLDSVLGWWESIDTQDFDGDGDLDLVVGNMGSNNFYQPSKSRPVTLLAKDFDHNGSIDPILFAYLKKDRDSFESFPVNFWGDLFGQSPMFRAKFQLYKDFAKTTQESLFTAEELKDVKTFTGNYDKSSYVENLGDGKFKILALPMQAQLAPINDIVITDYNKDGNLDLLMVGNDYGAETFIGRYDALNGVLFKGNGAGTFEPVESRESGFLVPGDAKAMAEVKSALGMPLYIVTQNKGKMLVFQKTE